MLPGAGENGSWTVLTAAVITMGSYWGWEEHRILKIIILKK
jgi:hypothetical protein